jgi:hypothetical protein
MTHPMYQTPLSTKLLSQGDILIPDLLGDYLIGHQDYFAKNLKFYRFMVLTQSCDLDLSRETSDFIFIGVIRKLDEVLGIRHVKDSKAKNSTDRLLHDLLNHNYNKRGFFFLPKEIDQGIEEDSVVDLRVMFSLHRVAYQYLLNARCGGITGLYAAQLGYMIGYMFNRVATPGWEEINSGENINDYVKSKIKSLDEKEKQRLKELLIEGNYKCGYKSCQTKANTYRWIPFTSQNDETVWEEVTLCNDHAEQWDKRHLNTKIDE